jgi:hypothetical protein
MLEDLEFDALALAQPMQNLALLVHVEHTEELRSSANQAPPHEREGQGNEDLILTKCDISALEIVRKTLPPSNGENVQP